MKYKAKEKEYLNLYKAFKIASTDKELFFEFMKDILTPKELEDVVIRFEIVNRLNKGEHHRDIAGDLGVGISTVTRGSREMRNLQGGFQKILNILNK